MKIKEKYEELKKVHQDEVVLFKVGSFYVTFSKDAIVLNYLFSYQLNNSKLGFPISAFEKVTTNLKEKNISFYIFEEEEKNYIFAKIGTILSGLLVIWWIVTILIGIRG